MDLEQLDDQPTLKSRTKWLRGLVRDHTQMGNRLIMIARRMKIAARNKDDKTKCAANKIYNNKTHESYWQTVSVWTKKCNLSTKQQQQISQTWKEKADKDEKNTKHR